MTIDYTFLDVAVYGLGRVGELYTLFFEALEYEKIYNWILLTQRIVDKAKENQHVSTATRRKIAEIAIEGFLNGDSDSRIAARAQAEGWRTQPQYIQAYRDEYSDIVTGREDRVPRSTLNAYRRIVGGAVTTVARSARPTWEALQNFLSLPSPTVEYFNRRAEVLA